MCLFKIVRGLAGVQHKVITPPASVKDYMKPHVGANRRGSPISGLGLLPPGRCLPTHTFEFV